MKTRSTKPVILAVDDSPSTLLTLGSILDSDFDLRVSTTGAEALEVVGAVLPDVILMDVNMPDMDGYETCQKLKQIEAAKDIPVLFVTTADSSADQARCFEVGGDAFIPKPIDRRLLLDLIGGLLYSKKL